MSDESVVQPGAGKLAIDQPALLAVTARLTDSGTGTRAKARYTKRRAWVKSVFVAIYNAGYDIVPRRHSKWEYRAGGSFFGTESETRNWADWLNGEGLEHLRQLAEAERIEEERTGVITTNTYRHALWKREKEGPVLVLRRKVSDWEVVDGDE